MSSPFLVITRFTGEIRKKETVARRKGVVVAALFKLTYPSRSCTLSLLGIVGHKQGRLQYHAIVGIPYIFYTVDLFWKWCRSECLKALLVRHIGLFVCLDWVVLNGWYSQISLVQLLTTFEAPHVNHPHPPPAHTQEPEGVVSKINELVFRYGLAIGYFSLGK